jgi:YHS domain-containing protein
MNLIAVAILAGSITHEGTDVYLCCKSCKKDFDKEPAKFMKVVKDAMAKK